MPSISRPLVLTLLAAVVAASAVVPASAGKLPTKIGACTKSKIKLIGGRLEGDTNFETGTGVIFDNGGVQISYDREEAVVHSRIGDPVRICLVELPKDCPPGDDRGKIYKTTNLRTGEHWEMPDSQHMCGGA
jgi:hypothetical protein